MQPSAIPPEAVIVLPGCDAALIPWRARGRLYVAVIAKATFAFAPDAEMPRVEPQEILPAEVHHRENPARSVRFTTDLVPFLQRADVLFTGHAHAPGPARVERVALRLALVAGERILLDKRLEARDGAGFSHMPVVYEGAFGGMDVPENPVGVREPTLVDPARPGHPAGFAPIARAWPARKRLLGSTPRRTLDAPIVELPDDFDGTYFQAAPADQRIDFLRGDEWILLEGLLAGAPRIAMRLPGASGRAHIHGLAAFGVPEGQPLDLVADTLRIDGDEQRCTVVWRQSFLVPGEAALAALRVVAGVELPSAPITWPEPPFDGHVRPPRAPTAAVAASLSATHDAVSEVDLAAGSVTLSLSEAELIDAGTAGHSGDPSPSLASSTLDIEPQRSESATRRPTLPFQPSAALSPLAAPSPRPPPPRPPGVPFTTLALPGDEPTGETSAPSPPVPLPAPVVIHPLAIPTAPELLTFGARPAGVLDASNAAAAAPAREAPAAPAAPPAPAARPEPRTLLDLVWFDPRALPRARKQPAWQPILDALRDKAPDPDIDDPALHEDPAAGEEQREIFEILAHGEPAGESGLRAALKAAIRDDGRFVPPLVLLAAELVLPFDEVETLKAVAAAITPLAAGDDAVRSTLDAVKELVAARDLVTSATVADGLATRLKEAYSRGKRALSVAQIEHQAERSLVENRHYQRRTLFGGRHLRALAHLAPDGTSSPPPPARPGAAAAAARPQILPAYLPDALAAALPMFPRFAVRIVAEVHLAADPYDAHPTALRIVALARSVPVPTF